MKLSKKALMALLVGLFVQNPSLVKAADGSSPTYLPNNYGKSLTTPVAWGASNNVIFVGVGGTTPAEYSQGTDGAVVLGGGIGDPVKNLGVQVSIVSLDVSQWQEYSASVHIFKDLGNANAIGVGVENVMITNGGDTGKSYYVVYSQGVQTEPFVNKTTGNSKLTYSIGVGSGRFGDKSPFDVASGKGEHGTYAFGNIAYDIADSFNVIADWNGLNLNAGVSKTFWVGNLPLALVVGAANLTHNSGDGVRLIGAVGTGFKL